MSKAIFYIIFFIFFTLSICSAGEKIHAPFGKDTPLPASTPQGEGFNTAILENMSQQIAAKKKHKLHSFLVLRNGKLIFEEYYNDYHRDAPHDIRSATKSITSLLTGIAIRDSILTGLDSPLMTYLETAYPEVQDKSDITIRHLLTMSSGLDCHDRDKKTRGQEDRMYKSKDWVKYFLDLERVYSPGDTSRYCTGSVVALGEAIARSSSKDFADFANQYLFAPLGINNYRWARYDKDRKVDTGGHLLITPQALIKIGMLVLQQGRWEDKQIVPASWIETATAIQTYCDGQPYGFLWWIANVNYGKKPLKVIMASGNGGQKIFIVPAFSLVAASTAGYYNSEKSNIPDQLFFNGILPAVEDLKPYISPKDNK